jgi:hypothetical protein
LPDQEDFYGSSNIPKISTTSIILSPASDMADLANNVYPTWIRVVKSRIGIRSTYAMLCDFDSVRKAYDSCYKLYRINSDGFVAGEAMPESELPKWAVKKDDKSKPTST